ncbi:M12 family metallo-peptidase [Chitinivorax sp. B]|uniref:M12 family metallo-peptidase n=1 Tax=Chitinivorax sp. B TaxID=2502235 RepID=UPI0010FA56AE|nr:M12 family metallo-peptidase [Chitinivorax sp. B]
MKCRHSVLALGLLISGAAQAGSLFVPMPERDMAAISLDQQRMVDQIKQEKMTKQISMVKLNLAALADDTLELTLRFNLQVQANRTRIDKRSEEDFTWYGTLSNLPGEATLVVRGDNVTGSIRSGKELYQIRPLGNGMHSLIQVDLSNMPDDEPPSMNRAPYFPDNPLTGQPEAVDSSLLLAPYPVSVAVAYTKAAETATADIRGTIQLAIDETNQSYINSGINARLQLGKVFRVNYNEAAYTYDTIVSHLKNTRDGFMDEVHTQRDVYSADVTMLVLNKTDFCGMAAAIKSDAKSAFATVHYSCATGYYSFAHEIGHLQGARHNPEADGSTTPYAFGHGYRYGNNWRTIMAYNCSSSCPRLQYWSNPNVSYGGVPMGTTATHDNARVLNLTASTVSGFRAPAGAIWRYTGVPCSGGSCPGWQMLDNNPKTVQLAAAPGHLYQLHNDGWIWRYTGVPCSGNSCPGWLRLDNNAKTVAIAADGANLYQLHKDGWIWRYTGVPCSGNSCPGWQRLDNNPKTIAVSAAGGNLYQLHKDGWIWRYTGVPCSGNSCPGWQRLDNNPKTIAIASAGSSLYQLHKDGWIWRYTGVPCSGDSCPGWQRLDNNAKTIAIEAAGSALYQLHNDGGVWRYTGTPCSGNSCPGWQKLDNNLQTVSLAAANSLYQLHFGGAIWRYTGVPCSGNSCPGWQQLDNNPVSTSIISAGSELYQLHKDPGPL